MSWARTLAATIAATTGACLLAPAPALAAIVVASSGPSASQYPPGRKLDDAQRIVLRDGDSVTVLDQRGTRVLKGAGSFSLTQASGANRAGTFAALTQPRAAQRVRTGAVRNAGPTGKVMSPNLWYVDLARPGTQCIVDPAAVRLWRADSAQAASYRITANGGVRASIAFPANETIAPWDSAAAPVGDGATFTISQIGTGVVGNFTFAALSAQPAGPEATASALIEKGCTAQLELLSASLSRTAQ